jgi:peptide/nickel transport system permease protein
MALAEPIVPVVTTRGVARMRVARPSWGRASLGDRIAIGVFVALILVAILAPVLAPYSPTVSTGTAFAQPFGAGHLLGTDEVGFDILSRVIYGLRASVVAVVLVVSSGVIIGGAIGLVAGVAGGFVDTVLMRLTDLFLALPGPVLAIAIVAALGPSPVHILIAVGIIWWPFYSRIMRAEVRSLAARPHLEAAQLGGCGPVRRATRHLLPGAVPAILVTASLDVGNLVLTLAALSFLGLGAPAPAPELGAMSARGLQYLLQEWWVPVMPGIAIFALALAANMAGDGLRDLLGVE